MLENLLGRLRKLSEDFREPVPVTDLLTDSFIKANTRFETFSEFSKASGIDINTEYQPELDVFVKNETSFESWRDMINSALQDNVRERFR